MKREKYEAIIREKKLFEECEPQENLIPSSESVYLQSHSDISDRDKKEPR